jgi:hypothetical protein
MVVFIPGNDGSIYKTTSLLFCFLVDNLELEKQNSIHCQNTVFINRVCLQSFKGRLIVDNLTVTVRCSVY